MIGGYRRWLWTFVLLLGACSTPEGTTIEITVNGLAADHVELFLGNTFCTDCTDGIAPKGEKMPLTPNNVYYRDGVPRYDAPVKHGVATFQLLPSDVGTIIDKAIAVGYAGTTELGIVELHDLDANRHVIYAAKLEAAVRRVDDLVSTKGTFVQVWNTVMPSGDPDYACVMIERRDGNQGHQYVTIVPKEDPDCDGVTGAAECEDHMYLHVEPPASDLGQVSCLSSGDTGGGGGGSGSGGSCRLGAGCSDGISRCQPGKFCVPDTVCDCDKLSDLQCLADKAKNAAVRVDCTARYTAGGAVCSSSFDAMHIDLPSFARQGLSCSAIRFVKPGPSPGLKMLSPNLVLENGASYVVATNLGTIGCIFELADYDVPVGFNAPVTTDTVMALTASNGSILFIPLRITQELQGCSGTNTNLCTLHGANINVAGHDGVWDCLTDP